MSLEENMMLGNVAATVGRAAFPDGAYNWPDSSAESEAHLESHRNIVKTTIMAKHGFFSSFGIGTPTVSPPTSNNLHQIGDYPGKCLDFLG